MFRGHCYGRKIPVDACDVEIRSAIIVIVLCGNAHAVAFTSKSSAICDVGKGSIAIVVAQTVIETRAVFDETRNGCAVSKGNIEISIIVVVKQGEVAKGAVDYRFVLGRRVIEDELNP